MDNGLSPQTEAAFRKLSREIGQSRGLDDETLEELYGHMEDKALGYLSGEEAVSQADVVLLTREHFGDIRNLKGFLCRVHQVEATVSLARRLVAVIVAGLGVWIATGAVRIVLASALAGHIPYYDLTLNAMILDRFGPMIVGMTALFLILKHWQRRLDRNEMVWFQTYAPVRLFAITIGLFLLFWCVPAVRINIVGAGTVPSHDVVQARGLAHNLLQTAFMFILPLIWIWWSDRRPRRIQAIFLTLATYFGYQVTVRGLQLLVGIPLLEVHDTGMDLTFFQYPYSGGKSAPSVAAAMNWIFSISFSTSIALGGALILYAGLLFVHRMLPRTVRSDQGDEA